MEVKIKSMKYEDFKDNEYIEHLVDELKASHTDRKSTRLNSSHNA